MLALLAALREEITGLHREMTSAEAIAGLGFGLYRGKYQKRDCLLVQTGLGKQRVETATRFVLEHFPVSTIISFGFGGALTAGLRAGDIIVCSTVYYCNGTIYKGRDSESLSTDANLLELATRVLRNSGRRFLCGSSVTVPQLVSNPESKEKLYRISQAHIADMESYWVARIASEERIPFLGIRAVSDASQDSLPHFDQILAGDGNLPWRKAFSHFVLHPQDLLKLAGLFCNSRKARRSLTKCIAQVVANMN